MKKTLNILSTTISLLLLSNFVGATDEVVIDQDLICRLRYHDQIMKLGAEPQESDFEIDRIKANPPVTNSECQALKRAWLDTTFDISGAALWFANNTQAIAVACFSPSKLEEGIKSGMLREIYDGARQMATELKYSKMVANKLDEQMKEKNCPPHVGRAFADDQ